MIKHGIEPFLECSSKGEKRLSAFYARPSCLQGKSIEEAYQASKIFSDGSTGLSVKEAKGKVPINAEDCALNYSFWWKEYIKENPELLKLILSYNGLSDIFGQKNHVCQASELWKIRSRHKKIVTGIGSRETPQDIINLIKSIALKLSKAGWTLRSGGADGADKAFEYGWGNQIDRREIYIPWDNFNGLNTSMSGVINPNLSTNNYDIAARFHPNWDNLKDSVKKLHARNVNQVLGKNLDDPSSLVLFWAKVENNNVCGGTGQAIRIANHYNLITENLFFEDVREKWSKWVDDTPTLVNIKKTKDFDVYIGRSKHSKEWGFDNPFVIGVHGERGSCVKMFEKWMRENDSQNCADATPERRLWILNNLHSLSNKTIGCFCHPSPCHGDVLIQLYRERNENN